HYLMDESGNFALDLTQDPLPLSELGEGKPQPDWSNKRLVGVAFSDWAQVFFWDDYTHSRYNPDTKTWYEDPYTDSFFRYNSAYDLPKSKWISSVQPISGRWDAFRIFWSDGTHSETKENYLTKNTDGFDERGYRSNKELPDWAR
ncbi:hypothetical protein M2G67_22305, partial [Vibrio vulnificus]|nr:hypothetical protein [Vibrio vulnificus]